MIDERPDAPAPTYTMGYSDEFRQLLDRRSAETHAAYLLPRLEPGMRVLDFGCGPGTITVGLAKLVEPGEVHGVDMEESQIEIARAAAAAGGHDNVAFHFGNILDLPFEDSSFDVAHCHAVLMHVPDVRAALAEVKRVLKPGGIVAGREMIVSSSFVEPDLGGLNEAWGTFSKLLAANGGHPEMGRQLKGALLGAGFADLWTSAAFEPFSAPGDVAFLHGFVIDWFLSPTVIEAATKYGLTTREEFDAFRRLLDEWKERPDAFAAFAWGEAVGHKP